jgi:hypothetical protein
MGAFGLERAAQGTAGTAKRAGGVPEWHSVSSQL